MEKIEEEIEDSKRIQEAGFMNLAHMDEYVHHAILGLIEFGDPFEINLGQLLAVSDLNNTLKILRIWQNLCEQHVHLYRIARVKEKNNALA